MSSLIDKLFPTWFRKVNVTFSGNIPAPGEREQVLVLPLMSFEQRVKSEILQVLKRVEDEVIGEDEEDRYSYSAPIGMDIEEHRRLLGKQEGQRALRLEQRQALSKLMAEYEVEVTQTSQEAV